MPFYFLFYFFFFKGQTTLSTKSRWRFRTKRRWKESFDHTRLHTFLFFINRLVTVRQSKTRTNVKYRSPAARLENDEMTKRVFLHPPRSLIYDVRYVNIFMKVVLTTFMTPYENVVLYRVWFGPKWEDPIYWWEENFFFSLRQNCEVTSRRVAYWHNNKNNSTEQQQQQQQQHVECEIS